MRCFIAIEAPKELFSFQEEFKLKGIKLVNNYHLTISFLGEISEEKAEEIKKKLVNVSFKKFKLEFTRLGAFPNQERIRVIWAGLKDTEEFQNLKKQIDEITGANEDEKSLFVPHITIGRVKFIEDKKKLTEKLKLKISGAFMVEEVILFKSTLTEKGPIYEVLGKASSSS